MWQEIRSEVVPAVKSRFVWSLTSIIDGIFLIGWAILQYFTDVILNRIPLVGISQLIFLSFQILFAIATLLPVIIFIQKDARIMWKRSEQEIAEVKKGKRVPFRELVKKE